MFAVHTSPVRIIWETLALCFIQTLLNNTRDIAWFGCVIQCVCVCFMDFLNWLENVTRDHCDCDTGDIMRKTHGLKCKADWCSMKLDWSSFQNLLFDSGWFELWKCWTTCLQRVQELSCLPRQIYIVEQSFKVFQARKWLRSQYVSMICISQLPFVANHLRFKVPVTAFYFHDSVYLQLLY